MAWDEQFYMHLYINNRQSSCSTYLFDVGGMFQEVFAVHRSASPGENCNNCASPPDWSAS
jgi:hypothetical protein